MDPDDLLLAGNRLAQGLHLPRVLVRGRQAGRTSAAGVASAMSEGEGVQNRWRRPAAL